MLNSDGIFPLRLLLTTNWCKFCKVPTGVRMLPVSLLNCIKNILICIRLNIWVGAQCYSIIGEDLNNNRIEKEWHFGYSNENKSIVLSDPQNPTCDSEYFVVNKLTQIIQDENPQLFHANNDIKFIYLIWHRIIRTQSSLLYDER